MAKKSSEQADVGCAVPRERPQATKGSLRKMLTGSVQLILIEISHSRGEGPLDIATIPTEYNLWRVSPMKH